MTDSKMVGLVTFSSMKRVVGVMPVTMLRKMEISILLAGSLSLALVERAAMWGRPTQLGGPPGHSQLGTEGGKGILPCKTFWQNPDPRTAHSQRPEEGPTEPDPHKLIRSL